eukprot:CAMPEP_0197560164 /NCGR_PEP_ID=MMETSP1320-20131121/22598_1 /TAXON_ID=91990 /ORGANISM="Bolidomonas sp., Strain RCC2347" /LENGTH=73 /DNA_ID=CAMNT_0043121687 /DNA_START=68 /DNA_END=286 /DNA_ORIENTATION=-
MMRSVPHTPSCALALSISRTQRYILTTSHASSPQPELSERKPQLWQGHKAFSQGGSLSTFEGGNRAEGGRGAA